jgi:hypothetical protein
MSLAKVMELIAVFCIPLTLPSPPLGGEGRGLKLFIVCTKVNNR